MTEIVGRILGWLNSGGYNDVTYDGNRREFWRTITFLKTFLLVGCIIVLIVLLLSPGGLLDGVFGLP